MKLGILMIGYNRPDHMNRLFESIKRSYFGSDKVDLLISIDNSGTDAVEKMASGFEWIYGEKKIYTYPERLGLRRHIIHCGSFLSKYDAIAVFEDDLVVSPAFYMYMKQIVNKYCDEEQVAGISFYTNLWNHNAGYPFAPCPTKYDVYFLQMAQSWGQIWMRKQWSAFMDWYEKNSEDFPVANNFPDFMTKWSRSWLKYHNKYCVENNKYFVYPYNSYSTCFSEAGEHSVVNDSNFQVPLMDFIIDDLRLPDFSAVDAAFYDIFYERENMYGMGRTDVTVDIYGMKNRLAGETKYLLSTKRYCYKVLKSYGLQMRPQELNIIYGIPGNDIFLYDTEESVDNPNKADDVSIYTYYHHIYGKTKFLNKLALNKIKENIKKNIQLLINRRHK